MALTDTIARLLGRTSATTRTRTTLDDTPQPASMPSLSSDRFTISRARASVIRECRDLYRTDARIRRILKSVSADVVKGGYTVTVRGDQRAADIAAAQEQRLKLTSRLDDWTHRGRLLPCRASRRSRSFAAPTISTSSTIPHAPITGSATHL